ncbi:tag-52 [Pristionchus pacificus]|uniref:Tag-52 n=1 Tax=Pristionchus pacificus TaxID=54126 RepID=A0A2A6CY17_PRIPA|nr:tag-52 [Pristionchus pacificus]|eukprot:PDM82921.1 tag-52 [Pristionchus pacificus]
MQRVLSEFEFVGSMAPSTSAPSTYRSPSPSETSSNLLNLNFHMEFPNHRFLPEEGRSDEYTSVREELYNTERAYLQYLKALIETFLKPLCETAKYADRLDAKKLLAEINPIFAVHKEILRSLRESPSIHSSFEELTPYLKLYSSYAAHYGRTQDAIVSLSGNLKFRSFIEKLESNSMGHTLTSLLVMPIQRIPRYVLLLKRLQEATDRQDEKESLEKVLHEVEEIAEYMQICIRDYENVQKLLEIQDKITIPGGIVIPGRRFIYEGTLFHRVNVGESIYRERIYDLKFRFPLRHCTFTYDQWDGSLQIKCKGESIVATSDTFDKLSKWRDLLSSSIVRATKLRATLRKESSRLPVKMKKTNLKKALTKRIQHFTAATYDYGLNRMNRGTTPAESTDRPGPSSARTPITPRLERLLITEEEEHLEESMTQGHFPETPRLKRKALQTEFDRELEAVVRKRCPQDTLTPSSTGWMNPLTPATPKSQPPARPPPPTSRSPVKRNEKARENGMDSPVRLRSEHRAKVQRTLTQPQIRKLSYLEDTDLIIDEAPEDVRSVDGLEAATQPKKSQEQVPWWVTEATPAQYQKATEQSAFSRMTSRCSVM